MQNEPTVTATSGNVTVTLTPLTGHDGYWTQRQAEDGDPFGDVMVVHIEDDETPQDYAQRWAANFATA